MFSNVRFFGGRGMKKQNKNKFKTKQPPQKNKTTRCKEENRLVLLPKKERPDNTDTKYLFKMETNNKRKNIQEQTHETEKQNYLLTSMTRNTRTAGKMFYIVWKQNKKQNKTITKENIPKTKPT